MNFLAHLVLAGSSPAWRVGCLLPDLVRGPLSRDLDPVVARGVEHHRRVDRLTDTNAATQRSVARLQPRQGRFSGILSDVFFDHFLACDWPAYCSQTLDGFTHAVYDDLCTHAAILAPRSVEPIFQRMARQDWLGSYATLDGIELTLWRMSQRLTQRLGREVRLDPAVSDLACGYEAFRSDFNAVWRDLIQHAAEGSVLCSEQTAEVSL
jgi:acyl carrier protein phosphodiesterase